MLADTVVMAFVCSLLWALRRTVSIRSYETLHETERYPMQHYQHSVQDIDESIMLEPLDEPISTYKTDNH